MTIQSGFQNKNRMLKFIKARPHLKPYIVSKGYDKNKKVYYFEMDYNQNLKTTLNKMKI